MIVPAVVGKTKFLELGHLDVAAVASEACRGEIGDDANGGANLGLGQQIAQSD